MLCAKKEQLETGSDPHKIEWIRLATDLADTRLQERDLKRRPRRAQRLDHVREAISGTFGLESRSGSRSAPHRVLQCRYIRKLGFSSINLQHFLHGRQLGFIKTKGHATHGRTCAAPKHVRGG